MPLFNKNNFKVSVIIPIYNTGRYLQEALDSIYSQSFGLDNIQIILIDDGSTDESTEICRNAKSLYRRNIVFKEQPHKGVSAARNKGMKYVRSEYVTFLDSDDTLDPDFISFLYTFMEENKNSIDMVIGRIRYFEKKEGFLHKLDYKFKNNGIVDLTKSPDYVQQHVITALYKSKEANKYRFDESLEMGEDVLYVSEYLNKTLAYGIENRAVYNYRVREDNTAASSFFLKSRQSIIGIVGCWNRIFDLSEERFGSVIPYYQNVIMFDLQFRISNDPPDGTLNKKEKEEYIDGIIQLLRKIDDSVILKQKSLLQGYKIYALSLKHGFNIVDKSTIKDNILYYNDNSYLDLRNHLKIISAEGIDGKLEIVGRQSYSIIDDAQVFANVRGTDQLIPVTDRHEQDIVFKAFDGNTAFTINGFSVSVPCKSLEEIDFILKVKEESIVLKKQFA